MYLPFIARRVVGEVVQGLCMEVLMDTAVCFCRREVEVDGERPSRVNVQDKRVIW